MTRIIIISIVLKLLLFSPKTVLANNESGFRFNNPRRNYVNIHVNISNNLIVVPIRINNSPPLNFLLDTGVKTTILTEPILLDLLMPEDSEPVLVLGLGKEGYILAEKVKNMTISLNGITGKNMDIIVLPDGLVSFTEHLGFPVYGILGYDLFKEFPIRINYKSKTIRIYQTSNYRILKRRTTRVPLNIIQSKPYVNTFIEGHNGKRDTVEILVDLGASAPLLLHEDYFHFSEKHIESYLGKGLSGKVLGNEGRIKELRIKDIIIDNPIVAYPQGDFLFPPEAEIENWEGILGGGILSRFRIIIDYPGNVMYLRKNSDFGKPFEPNLSGLEIVAEGAKHNKYKVHYVRPDSPADEAGIMEDDYIIEINNHPAVLLGLDEIIGKLNSRPRDIVYMKVQREGKIFIKRIVLRADI